MLAGLHRRLSPLAGEPGRDSIPTCDADPRRARTGDDMDMKTMTAAQLVAVHNARCDNERQIKEWRASKAALIERIEALKPSKPQRKATEKATPQARGAIGRAVAMLLRDPRLSYADILQMVRAANPKAATSTRSIASVAAAMRREGVDVPLRRSAGVN